MESAGFRVEGGGWRVEGFRVEGPMGAWGHRGGLSAAAADLRHHVAAAAAAAAFQICAAAWRAELQSVLASGGGAGACWVRRHASGGGEGWGGGVLGVRCEACRSAEGGHQFEVLVSCAS